MEQEIINAVADGENNGFYSGIILGALAVVILLDKASYYVSKWLKKKNGGGESHAECGELAKEVHNLTAELRATNRNVETLIESMKADEPKWITQQRQVSDIYDWMKPDSSGSQNWRQPCRAK